MPGSGIRSGYEGSSAGLGQTRQALHQVADLDLDTYEWKLGITQSYMRPDMDVLEIGCGSGNTGRRHAPLVRSYTAMDISSAMLEAAKDQGSIPDNMRFVHADFDRADVAPGSYDMILALSVLHLLPNPAFTVKKIGKACARRVFCFLDRSAGKHEVPEAHRAAWADVRRDSASHVPV